MDEKEKTRNPMVSSMLAGFGAISLSVGVFFLIYEMKNIAGWISSILTILRPFIIGAAIAYLLCPLCNTVQKWAEKIFPNKVKKFAGHFSVGVSIIVALLIIYLLLIMIIPQTYSSVMILKDTFPPKAEAFINRVGEWLENEPVLYEYATNLYDTVSEAFNKWLTEKLLPDLGNVIDGVGSGVVSAITILKDSIIGLIVALYCLSERKMFAKQSKKLLYSISGKRWGDIIYNETKFADRMFTSFLTGKFVDSVIIGCITYFFCTVSGMPNALLMSVIIGVTNIIPFFGPFIGAVPTTLFILIESPMKALWFIIFILVLQQIDGNIIGPRILGQSVGLSSFWILFAIILFGGWFGFIGMIIGVPLFTVIYDIATKLIDLGLKKHGLEDMV